MVVPSAGSPTSEELVECPGTKSRHKLWARRSPSCRRAPWARERLPCARRVVSPRKPLRNLWRPPNRIAQATSSLGCGFATIRRSRCGVIPDLLGGPPHGRLRKATFRKARADTSLPLPSWPATRVKRRMAGPRSWRAARPRVSAEIGSNRCGKRSAGAKLDDQRSRRHNAPRRIAPWHSCGVPPELGSPRPPDGLIRGLWQAVGVRCPTHRDRVQCLGPSAGIAEMPHCADFEPSLPRIQAEFGQHQIWRRVRCMLWL